MLVSATEMLQKAKAGHYAVGQFNINNLEWTKAILLTAQENNSPVILGVSEGAGKYMGGYDVVVGMVNGLIKDQNITVPVALHLDHGSYEHCYKCIEAGFSSIYDNKKEITRSRLFVISGYYNETGKYIARPKCLTQTYQKLVHIVKRIAPYTEITDHIISTQNNDYLQQREWIHKEYISASCLKLKASKNYKLV